LSQSKQNCESLDALIPAYSIGATDPDEEAFVKQQLAECPAPELADYMELADRLHYSAPPVQAPPRVLSHLMVAVNRPAEARPAAALPGRRKRLSRAWGFRAAAAAAVIVLLVSSNLYWSGQLEQLRSSQQAMTARLEDQNTLLALIGSGAALRVDLLAAQPAGKNAPAATVFCDPQREVGLLQVKYFPSLPPEKAYQVWLIRGQQRISGGLFQVEADGSATFVFRSPGPMSTFDSIGITPEPAAGSPGPTSPPVVRGALYTYPG
jgi:hypothetical protein